jgi:hypothetical protein
MACPFCGCEHFYVKNPDDEYDTCEFDFKDGEIVLTREADDFKPEFTDTTVSYCNNCAWHGKLEELIK